MESTESYAAGSPEELAKRSSEPHDSSEAVVEDEDCDDDCVILDFDPTVKETAIDTCKTDEVLVVGQKGEIACRDFPHPRHACAKYSFESTPHQNYCEMCHCYVCDTRAPCPYWFADFPSIYCHCHANDKEQRWKTQREFHRSVNMVPRPVSEPSLTIAQSQQVSQSSSQRVSQPSSVPLPQNSASPVTQFGFRACSTSTSASIHPNVYTRPGCRNQQSKSLPQNPGSQPCVAQPLPNSKSLSYNGNPSPQRVSQPSSVPLPQNSASPVTQFGFRACSTSTRVSNHPNVYTRPGYRNQQSKSLPQNPGSQPYVAQPLPNSKSLSYNPSPQALSSNSYTRGVSRHRNRVQPTPYAPPAVSQGNPQRMFTSYISTVPEFHNKVYAGRDMYSASVQRIAVPSQTLNVPVNHHQQPQQKQQSLRSNDKVLSEFEDWLLDDSALTSPVSILPGQEDATAILSDFERFLND